MSYVHNEPANFASEAAAGFVAANSHLVRGVNGGVVRAHPPAPGNVAVVIGGGSGHYPAFAGLVGRGLAAGAAMGNLFASPSAQQVHSVARAADAGGGILFSYGNYAGDVLNFDIAASRLIAEGTPCLTVVVTDDVSSAPAAERAKRRGIAGGLIVYKVAGAAADAGAPLAEVARLAALANDRARTIGVAFSGCTFPGATEPLFSMPPGRMAIGMGIHGEPGLAETEAPSAAEIGRLFVSTLMEERPDSDGRGQERVALVLNGLGSTKYEELFVLYGEVARLLEDYGITIIEPEVGEMITSFEMAGTSLTLCWLDDELERWWRAPAYTAAYRKAGTGSQDFEAVAPYVPLYVAPVYVAPPVEPPLVGEATEGSRLSGALVVKALAAVREAIEGAVPELGRLDAVAGDGDHGMGMQRGISAALDAARRMSELGAGAGTVITSAGDAWGDVGGGTSGALWGAALRALGETVGDTYVPDLAVVARATTRAQTEIERHGKARIGDKTMLDAMAPFTALLAQAAERGDPLVVAWSNAAQAAGVAAEDTAALVPKVGRARPHGEKSLGTPDPGAVSFALIVKAVQSVIEEVSS
jgi:dihydroxyacetone kinase